ncbi:MAG: DUF2161 domain-containing phosphodiesterase [Pseudomonadota bacterium]
MRETDLYPPVKAFLEDLGYEVKAEIGPADVMACKDGAAPIFVELKTAFSLALFHQGLARLAISDSVYLAVPRKPGRPFAKAVVENTKLARRLGLGLMTVRLPDGVVEVHCDPGPYAPRKNTRKQAALMAEFAKRRGDPNLGGMNGARVTAYRQDALACAVHLAANGASKGSDVKAATGVTHATRILRDNHYGWFEKEAKGIYRLSDTGETAAKQGAP